MRMFITSKNKYISNNMKIFGTCSIPLKKQYIFLGTIYSVGNIMNLFVIQTILLYQIGLVVISGCTISLSS